MTYRVKNWSKFQHYKDRCPPWIKLHWELLSSRDWVMLDDASRVLAVACMLIASRNGGEIPDDPEYVRRVAYLHRKPDFSPLVKAGFLTALADASECKRTLANDTQETETEEEEETEKERAGAQPPPLKSKCSKPEIPECLACLDGFAAEWCEYLKARKTKATPRAREIILGRLAERPGDAMSVLRLAIERGWTGIEWSWFDNAKAKPGGGARPINHLPTASDDEAKKYDDFFRRQQERALKS